jgi:hypothetical protein
MSDYSIVHTDEPGIVTITSADEGAAGAGGSTENLSLAAPGDGSGVVDEFFAPLTELAENDPSAFDRLFIDRLSKSLIVLVPMVAVLLQLLYWRPRYVAHLVFALHVHGFAFLILVVGAAVDGVFGLAGAGGGTTGNSAATLAILVYTYVALRRVYGQGRIVTFGKMAILMLGYAVALVMTMLATLIVTVAAL